MYKPYFKYIQFNSIQFNRDENSSVDMKIFSKNPQWVVFAVNSLFVEKVTSKDVVMVPFFIVDVFENSCLVSAEFFSEVVVLSKVDV